MRLAKLLLDIALPPRCLLCGGHAGDNLCQGCWADLPWLQGACTRCGIPLEAGAGPQGAVCGVCIKRPPPFDTTYAALDYVFPTTVLVRRFKFNRSLASGAVLSAAMVRAMGSGVTTCRPVEALVPVPLHATRQFTRLYNQAELLALDMGKALKIPVASRLLRRTRRTVAQSGLSAQQRASNLKGAFRARDAPPAHVALVDDVMTTGSTVGECARILKQAGAQTVEVWVAARAV